MGGKMKVVIYARVSSGNGRQDTERQVMELRQVAEKAGHEVVKCFEDFKSGIVPNKERPYLQECLRYCVEKSNEIGCVMVTEVSRLGRDSWEMLEVIKYFHDRKINVYFRDQNLSMYKKNGDENELFTIMFTLYSQFASLERAAIKERLQSGYKQYREKGGKVGRKKGSFKTKEQLENQYKHVLKELKNGMSIAKTAKLCDTSPATVARLKKKFGL